MKDYLKELCAYFVKRYENSIRSAGGNSKKGIILYPDKHIKGYKDDFDVCTIVNSEIKHLQNKGYVDADFLSDQVCKKVYFIESDNNVEYFHSIVNKRIKLTVNSKIQQILDKYYEFDVLKKFCIKQAENLKANLKVQYFHGDLNEFSDILKCSLAALKNENDIFIRDFSVRVFKSSKRVEQIQEKVKSLLFEYGEFAEKNTIFEDLGIRKMPSFVYFKGQGCLYMKDNKSVDISVFKNGIGVSSLDLQDITAVSIMAKRIVTIENLTSFYTFNEPDYFAIYLGGYHNNARRKLIKTLYINNEDKEYWHYGDIDAGGFYILEHLKARTGINFCPLHMDIKTLEKNKFNWIKLTENDKKRLRDIINSPYKEVIEYMLINDCKIEQEAIQEV